MFVKTHRQKKPQTNKTDLQEPLCHSVILTALLYQILPHLPEQPILTSCSN